MNFITEETNSIKADIDLVKPLVQKRVVKSLTFFNKFVSPKKKDRKGIETSLIDIIKVAIEKSLSIEFKPDEQPNHNSKKKMTFFNRDTNKHTTKRRTTIIKFKPK